MRLLNWLYRRLGPRYPPLFLAIELLTAFPIAAGTLALFALYYDAAIGEYLRLLGLVSGLVAVTIAITVGRMLRRMVPLRRWIAGERDADSTAVAWATAVGLPLELVRLYIWIPVLTVTLPASAGAILIFDLAAWSLVPLLAGSLIALAYAAILHYLAIETGMRPVLVDINSVVSPRLNANCAAIPLKVRLMAALPIVNVITGLTVAALTPGNGSAGLGVDVLIAVGVASTISLELTAMLSASVLRPLRDISAATARIAEGDYEVVVPVTTGDEIGELAAAFNTMIAGLAERERIRDAFGTYLDKEVAEYILSEEFSEQGVEREVSVMFCDVKDFTRFTSGSSAHDVVALLNELFDVVVPIIARHGGHVDKFEGDGLMAVFGAPRSFSDHASRAVRAALEIDDRVNAAGEGGPFEIGIGINTGPVVAGSVGGGGRLNFSVIGDPVNVAARVEAETRRLGQPVLVTAATRERLGEAFELSSCGTATLKGVERPVELFAPAGENTGRGPARPPAAAGV